MNDLTILILWCLFAFVWLPLWCVHFLCIFYVLVMDAYRDFQRQRREDAALIRIVQLLREDDAARHQTMQSLAEIMVRALSRK